MKEWIFGLIQALSRLSVDVHRRRKRTRRRREVPCHRDLLKEAVLDAVTYRLAQAIFGSHAPRIRFLPFVPSM